MNSPSRNLAGEFGAVDAAARVFTGDSELARLCRALHWTATPLGAVEGWPQSLRTAAGLVLACPVGMILLWGPQLVQLYNDECAKVMGAKHP